MRQSVSVIVPFLGDVAEGRALVERLSGLRRETGDELIVADNTSGGVVEETGGIRVVRAGEQRSATHARNAGAAAASGAWLLFLDADCLPGPDLLDAYFDPVPGEHGPSARPTTRP